MPKKKGAVTVKNPNRGLKTLVAVVLDETGSMGVRTEETISSVNFYLNEIEKENPNTLVTIAEFSDMGTTEDKVRFLERNTKVSDTYELTEETYRPRGNTPLYDAVGLTIRAVENEKVDRFLFVIVTDGFENASREFTKTDITSLISEKEKTDRWTFVYLAAGQDAWSGAQQMGISTPGTTFSYSGNKGTTAGAATQLSRATAGYLKGSLTVDPNLFGEDTVVASDDQLKLWKPDK